MLGSEMKLGRLLRRCSTAFAVLASFAFAEAGQAQNLTPVTIRMDVFFYGSHVPILLGIVDGIYKKHGLEVTAQTGRGSATTIQTVANGTDQFGFADGGTLVKFAAQGLKAKQIVGILEKTPAVIFSFADKNIHAPKDLLGKTGGFGNGSAPEQLFPAFLKRAGVTDASSIKRVAVDIPTRDNLFLQRQIDFSFGYTVTQLPLLQEKCSCKLNTMLYADEGLVAISNGIIVSDNYAKDHPDITKAFAQATAEAIDAAIKDSPHAVEAFFSYAKDTQLSRNVVAAQWEETKRVLHTAATADKPTGVMDLADWQKTIELLVEYADVPKGAVSPEAVVSNDYLRK
jgi:NitT/TauT family transport system substrate-binding protein